MASPPGPEWQRLADLLIARRIELNDAWRNRQRFCRDTGAEYRIVHDIERKKRTNYSVSTLALLEKAYRWQPGSIRAVLEGGDPNPAPTAPTVQIYDQYVTTEPIDPNLERWIEEARRAGVDWQAWNFREPLEVDIFTHPRYTWGAKVKMLPHLRDALAEIGNDEDAPVTNGSAPGSGEQA